MEKRILEKLAPYGFEIEDLTPEQLEELREEILAEDRGEVILDGVLSELCSAPFKCQ